MLFSVDEVAALLLQTGFRKPITNLKLADIPNLKSALIDHHCMLKVKAAMDQYTEGLQQLGVLDLIQKYPHLAKQYFIAETKKVTAGLHIPSFHSYYQHATPR